MRESNVAGCDKVLTGQSSLQPLWARCVTDVAHSGVKAVAAAEWKWSEGLQDFRGPTFL